MSYAVWTRDPPADRCYAGPTMCHLRLGPTTYPGQPYLFRKKQRQAPLPCPDITVPLFFPCSSRSSPRTFFFLFSGNGSRRRLRGMSSSASGYQKSWPRYGEVPMTRCPDCPRLDPLKRLTCVRSARGNVGREFIKCESKPRQGKDGKVVFVLICLDLSWFWFCTLDLGIRVCIPLFRIWKNVAILSGWISTFGIEGL
jgi:hypothetical protein